MITTERRDASTLAAQLSAAPAPDAVAPPPRHPRFPLIDGMRAIAVLSVVLVHAALTSQAFGPTLPGRLLAHMNVGVTIFFLISGFLLYRPMIAHRTASLPWPTVRDYARRRVLRIYPAYWLALTALFLVPSVSGVAGGNWWPMYSLLHTLPIYSGPQCWARPNSCGMAQTWTLVVELTFYVALPVYARLAAAATRRMTVRNWVASELVFLTALSVASLLLEYVILWPAPPTWLTKSVVGYIPWFALGMGMAIVSVSRSGPEGESPAAGRTRWPVAELCWGLAAVVYVCLSLWLPASPFLLPRNQQVVCELAFGLIATLLLFPAVFGPPGLPGRLLATRTMAWIGLISYGIFLWHYAVALKLGYSGAHASFVVVLLGTLAISIPLAAASYYLLERPVLRLKYRSLRDVLRRPRSAGASG
jgi:peptidoglycan/LPS O-acetylase OafA/YrhL